MKFSIARTVAISTIATLLAALQCGAQNSPSTPPAPPKSDPSQPAQSTGQVIFSRSVDADGNTISNTGSAAGKHSAQIASAPSVEDAERRAITFTGFDLDVRLQTDAQQIVVRALVTVRNTSKTALPRIPLQISSSLNWERIRIGGRDVTFSVATLNSDADHTGQLHEAAVPLPQPLAPGASLQLDVTYSGTIAASAQRLLTVGTPEDAALHSDWDQISASFTGLRGFGNVVWYPVSSVPVILGDGARLFDEIGTHKLHLSGAAFRLRLTVEFPHGQPPTVALVNGHPLPLTIADSAIHNPDVSGVATGATTNDTLAFEAPSLFVAVRTPHTGAHVTAFTLPEDEVAVKSWLAAAAEVSPFVERWLGPQPRAELTLLDLPDADDAPWESGALLAIGFRQDAPQQMNSVLAHALTHAWMSPTPSWLNEGASNFMGIVWVERHKGRDQAVATLEAGRPALALAEPASPGDSAGQPLSSAISPVYYRTKAAYVLMMLRDLIGDDALASALRDVNATPSQSEAAQTALFEQFLKKAAPRRDFSWFFSDWIDADKGLPDLTIDKVFPNAVQSGNWLVSVSVSNAGYVAAEVPVIVRSATNTTAERILVPDRGNITHRMLIQGRPTEVQVNDGIVPETQAGVHITRLDQPEGGPSPTSPPQ